MLSDLAFQIILGIYDKKMVYTLNFKSGLTRSTKFKKSKQKAISPVPAITCSNLTIETLEQGVK